MAFAGTILFRVRSWRRVARFAGVATAALLSPSTYQPQTREFAVRQQDRIERGFGDRLAKLERLARGCVHRALFGRQRAEHRHESGAVHVDRAQPIADIAIVTRRTLCVQPRSEHAQQRGHAIGCRRAGRRAVAVLLAEVHRRTRHEAALAL